MKKNLWGVLLLSLTVLAPAAHAEDLIGDTPGGYHWNDKLGRGVLNMVGSPVEVARTVSIQSRAKGAGYGWTAGLIQGLGKGLVRFGAGALETITFPFNFPDENKAPLLKPEYPWQKWDSDYL